MLRSHSAICLRQGLTEGQLRQMTEIVNGLKEDAAPPLCTRHADARQSELHAGRGVVARLCRRAGWFRLHGVAGVTFVPRVP